MTAIIAGIMSLIMLIGGIIPLFSNKSLEDSLKVALNNPEKIDVKIYSTPSYKILGGYFDRVEINAKKLKFARIEFDSLRVITSPLKMNYSPSVQSNGLDLIKNGRLEAQLILSPESLARTLDIQSLTVRINNALSNFKLPIPMLSGNVSVDNLKLSFENNRPSLTGNFIALGGFVTVPFSITGDLIVTAKNTVDLYKPQISIMGEPLVLEQVQELVRFINPVIDINKFNTPEMNLTLKSAYFKDNKLKINGIVTLKND
jgi:hypothetical protein